MNCIFSCFPSSRNLLDSGSARRMAHRPRPRAPVQTLDRQTPHERSKQSHNFTPSALRKRLPKSRTELDVLVEHHKFIREVREGAERQETEEKLSWEDELAEKFYATLFREFAVVNLKHFKSHQVRLTFWSCSGRF